MTLPRRLHPPFYGFRNLHDALDSRAIPIGTQRKNGDQPVAALRVNRYEHLHEPSSQVTRFVNDNETRFREADPELPEDPNKDAAKVSRQSQRRQTVVPQRS